MAGRLQMLQLPAQAQGLSCWLWGAMPVWVMESALLLPRALVQQLLVLCC
jgi:hypothetical protein